MKPFEETLKNQDNVIILNPLTDIKVIDVKEEVDLGIKTEAYSPLFFDSNRGFQLNASDIKVYEIEQGEDLDFDVNQYLP